jgi:hypothetical protein
MPGNMTPLLENRLPLLLLLLRAVSVLGLGLLQSALPLHRNMRNFPWHLPYEAIAIFSCLQADDFLAKMHVNFPQQGALAQGFLRLSMPFTA